MINLQEYSDKTAIVLSLLCTVHCLALPVLLIAFPSLTSLFLNDETFHFWMVLAVIPISIYALSLGCKRHQRRHLLMLGGTGMTFLLLAVGLPESLIGEVGEKGLTLLGSGLIAFGHFRNYQMCKSSDRCCV